ncbi:phosphatase PAP2 family protein [Streptomyces glomeratus]|uniref:Phosphatase PAP2 family protein n=1 Tax=Streptomyces glomeratus TaxID=284452 RepID=A0ABP6LNX6_9ACTN|nr:phosphatase PAP2 family protein [Streptomyces glomeratus]MCF1510796.1 phosphatase PAP2 family protein [Streptomyces glomeratus]
MDSRTEPETQGAAAIPRPPLVRELLLVAGLFLVYKFGRRLANGHTAEAHANAHRVWHWERSLHLPGEGAVQSALLHGDTLVRAANLYYVAVHFTATAAFLVWLYVRRPAHYVWARQVLALVTGAALALHLTFPLAPPRMLDVAHLMDTGQVYGPTVYGAEPETDSMANQFAAMPSLHFGWALMVAIGLIAATRSRLRWLWLLHPLLTLVVIVGTANHYWLDGIVASALLGLALAVVRTPSPASDEASTAAPLTLPAPRPTEPATAAERSASGNDTPAGGPSAAEGPGLVGAGR